MITPVPPILNRVTYLHLSGNMWPEVTVLSKLNEKLRILMANQGWPQKRLAERMFVSPDTVSSWVRGINHPTLETVKELCEILCIPIEELTNDNIDVPEYEEVERKLPYPICCYPEDQQDTEHIIIDAALANEGMLHRFTNAGGAECSAIYRGGTEVWWHYREREAQMIRDWNKEYAHD